MKKSENKPQDKKEKRQREPLIRFKRMQLVMLVFVLLLVVLLTERRNVRYEASERKIQMLENVQMEDVPELGNKCLVLWNSGEPNSTLAQEELTQILPQLKVSFDMVDMAHPASLNLDGYGTLVLAVEQLDSFGEDLFSLFNFVENGGNMMVMLMPDPDNYMTMISGRMGIRECEYDRYKVESLRFKRGFMLGSDSEYPVTDPYESALSVLLDSSCTVYLVSADQREMPLIWKTDYGEGQIVVDNLNFFSKAYRGFYAASYSLLGDAFAWPVIDASTFYLDDFPSPVPDGNSEYITRDFHMDINSFYTNVWWPDIQGLAERFGIRYTGMVIENYSDEHALPLDGNTDLQRFTYFGNQVLDMGGEIGFHGYNHMPLVLPSFDYMGEYDSYRQWDSQDDIRGSLQELDRFCKWIFPDEEFHVYVPPSNILSDEGRKILAEDFLDVRAVASTYLPGNVAYSQEFEIAEDGIIETPRIISGYQIDEFMYMVAMSELNFHYVNSHFQHPDDVMDEDRGAELGWTALKGALEDYLEWLDDSAPDLRNLTGSEMAGAVQRWCYLTPVLEYGEKEIHLTLYNFQDEASLFVRVNTGEVSGCTGGEAIQVAENLYLVRAEQRDVTLELK